MIFLKRGLLVLFVFCSMAGTSFAELKDQGLSSILSIIDKAVENLQAAEQSEDAGDSQPAIDSIINLSKTLGTLSYSRLQCGEAAVLSEFTLRVQKMPQDSRDKMRDAFQEGFDKSKANSTLLSADECLRLTKSRNRAEQKEQANVKGAKVEEQAKDSQKPVKKEPEVAEDPKLRHMRIAELSGQLAYKRHVCGDKKVANRDYNQLLEKVPEEYRQQAKDSYWSGYKHGKRLLKGALSVNCG